MAEFALINSYFDFGQKVSHQIFGTAIGMKFSPPYAFMFMDKFQPFNRYIDDIFFTWALVKKNLKFIKN